MLRATAWGGGAASGLPLSEPGRISLGTMHGTGRRRAFLLLEQCHWHRPTAADRQAPDPSSAPCQITNVSSPVGSPCSRLRGNPLAPKSPLGGNRSSGAGKKTKLTSPAGGGGIPDPALLVGKVNGREGLSHPGSLHSFGLGGGCDVRQGKFTAVSYPPPSLQSTT